MGRTEKVVPISPFAHADAMSGVSLTADTVDASGGEMVAVRSILVASVTAVVLAASAAAAYADVPVGPANYVPCPPPTGDIIRYTGAYAPYICHSAVVDPLGNVVILRRGQSYASTPSGFGMLHTLFDHNVEDHVVERVVSSNLPFGVLTAYCKLPRNAGPENKCPDWVNDTL